MLPGHHGFARGVCGGKGTWYVRGYRTPDRLTVIVSSGSSVPGRSEPGPNLKIAVLPHHYWLAVLVP